VFAAVVTADGHSYRLGTEIALTLIAFVTAAGLAVFAAGLNRGRPWTRTPVVMTQLFVAGYGLWALVDAHRLSWGVPALLLAAACLAGLFTPASLRALNRPLRPPVTAPAAPAAPRKAAPGPSGKQPARKAAR